jgi:hypothetical protein
MQIYDEKIKDILKAAIEKIETELDSPAIFYCGAIAPGAEMRFRDCIEKLKESDSRNESLCIILNTPGGSAETVEKMVEISRHHYRNIVFIVPDYAMSAGTIFCMSGNKIIMDYTASLGPIDPQVNNGKEWVPAMGYLDKVNEMIEKSAAGTLSNAEFAMLQGLDLATLSRYEQARNLTITLLKKLLVEYKFANWVTHESTPGKIGTPVTLQEKNERAVEIAAKLGDNKLWHSHGRHIGINTLRGILRLKIDNLLDQPDLRKAIKEYNELACEYIRREKYPLFLHNKAYF